MSSLVVVVVDLVVPVSMVSAPSQPGAAEEPQAPSNRRSRSTALGPATVVAEPPRVLRCPSDEGRDVVKRDMAERLVANRAAGSSSVTCGAALHIESGLVVVGALHSGVFVAFICCCCCPAVAQYAAVAAAFWKSDLRHAAASYGRRSFPFRGCASVNDVNSTTPVEENGEPFRSGVISPYCGDTPEVSSSHGSPLTTTTAAAAAEVVVVSETGQPCSGP